MQREFKASLVYIASSRIARAHTRDIVQRLSSLGGEFRSLDGQAPPGGGWRGGSSIILKTPKE